MQLLLITFILLLFSGCVETLELPSSKEKVAENQIKLNQTEAQKAKEEYMALQKQRNNE